MTSGILAIDLATRTGWCRGHVGEFPEFGSVNFGKTGKVINCSDAVFASAMAWMSDLIADDVPDVVIIESLLPPEAMKNRTSRQVRDRLAGLHGVIRAVARWRGVGEIAEASVGQVRAHFIGTRSLGRDQAKKAVVARCHRLGWDVDNDNEADACALWSYACALADPHLALQLVPLFNPKVLYG